MLTVLDMICTIPGRPVSDEQRPGLSRQTAGMKATSAPATAAPAPAKKRGRPKKLTRAPATAPAAVPAKVVKKRKRSALRPAGSGYTRRSQLWAELKRLAPEDDAKFSYTQGVDGAT